MLADTASGAAVTPRSALAIADVWSCVRVLADAAAMCPLIVYRDGPGGRERVSDGPSGLLRAPAPGVTQPSLVMQLVAHLALWGEAFVGMYRQGGEVAQLGLLSPDRVAVTIRSGEPSFDYTDTSGSVQALTRADVIHVRGMSLDGVRGVSPVGLCRDALGLAASLSDHASAVMANGAIPKGLLRVPAGPGGTELAENLSAAWQTRHGGTRSAGRVAVVTGEVSFDPVSMPLADAEFVAQRKLSTAEVARIFRVPPWMIGAESGDSLTYSTTESQAAAFVKFGLGPWLRVIEEAVTASELMLPGTYAEFLTEGLLRADSAARADFYAKALDPATGWMTRAEVRERENLPREEAA